MFGLFAMLVFATAGIAGVAVIGSSVRGALPMVRHLAAERRALADDRVYLFSLIETPRHAGSCAPVAAALSPQSTLTAPAGTARIAATATVNRRARSLPVPLRAAA
ncbi:hypothetical protein [Novosphingobium sp.]|uniref:hypothetical protein n=1 Tax=Novosphingobium sp. TaxID=1874826 RepID=UPI00333F4180